MMRHILTIIFLFLNSIVAIGQNPAWKSYNRSDGLPSSYIFSFYQDRQGKIWVATDNGVAVYNGKTWKSYSLAQGLSSSLAYCIFQDSKQVIWVGLYEGGMVRLNAQNRFEKPHCPIYNSTVLQIFEDIDGKLCFVGSNGIQVYESENHTYLEDKNKIHKPAMNHNNSAAQVFEDCSKQVAILQHKYNFVLADKNHLIYAILINKNKLDVYDADGRLKKSYHTDKTLSALNLDRENNLWISTFGQGLYKILGEQLEYIDGTEAVPIHALYIDAHKNEWVGNDNFFYVIEKDKKNGKTKAQKIIKSKSKNEFAVRAFAGCKQADRFWMGTLNRLYGPARKQELLTNLKNCPSMRVHDGVADLHLDTLGRLWVATFGSGIFCMAHKDTIHLQKTNGLPTNLIEKLEANQRGIWAFTKDKGAIHIGMDFKIRVWDKKDGLPSPTVNFVYQDHEKDAKWFALDNGVFLVSEGKKKFYSTTEKISYIFRARQKNGHKNLFFLGQTGLHILHNNKLRLQNSFAIFKDKIEYINECLFDEDANKLLLGTDQGFHKINMGEFGLSYTAPLVSIDQVLLLDSALPAGHNLVFDHQENQIGFRFFNSSFSYEAKNQFAYVLIKNDKCSDTSIIKDNHIEFKSLSPGKYCFKIWAINSDGLYSQNAAITNFIIKPPFWWQWWFVGLVLLVLIVLAIWIARRISAFEYERRLKALELQNQLQQERERISRDLHDHVGAQLSYIISSLDLVGRRANERLLPQEKERITDLAKYTRSTMGNLRDTIWALQYDRMSLDDFAAKTARYAREQFEPCPQTTLVFNYSPKAGWNLSEFGPTQAINLFRICQEAINNAIKYAQATTFNLEIEIDESNMLVLILQDNGIGIDSEAEKQESYGLANMKKRAQEIGGEFHIATASGKGTLISVFCRLYAVGVDDLKK